MERKSDYVILILAILGIFTFVYFYHQIYPEAGIRLPMPKEQIELRASKIIKQLGYDLSGYRKSLRFSKDNKQIKYLMHEFGAKQAIDLMREEVPVYYWTVVWKKPVNWLQELKPDHQKDADEPGMVIKIDGEVEDSERFTGINVSLSTRGELLGFEVERQKSEPVTTPDREGAFQIAQKMVMTCLAEEFQKFSYKNASGDSTFAFTWARTEPWVGETAEIEVKVRGAQIVKYERRLVPPENVMSISENDNFIDIPSLFVFLLYFIVFIILLVQKLRRDEVSIKSGIGFSIFGTIAFIISFLLSTNQQSALEIIIPIILVPVFLTISFLAIIGVAESCCRQLWPEKLTSFDLIHKLRVMNPVVGRNVIRGIALAFIALGLTTLLRKAFTLVPGMYFWDEDINISMNILMIPFLYVLSAVFIRASYSEWIFRVFSISFLRRKLNSSLLIILISAFLWIFNFTGDDKLIIAPIYLEMIKKFLTGMLFAYFFLRYDFITVLIGSLLFQVIRDLYPAMFWGDIGVMWNAIFLWIFLGAAIVFAILALRRKVDEKQLMQYTPPYVIRMQERERAKRELEIARKVQLSFLPKGVPSVNGIDVASLCIPAREVGGDYFDFIVIDRNRLGIAIGDVSGKGIPAAFHMTLTKGFLKSQAKETLSPRDILIRINELFYENVERNVFISMIYGLFDMKKMIFTFARAGHNPVIIRSGTTSHLEELCPRGIALGLEKGPIFNRIIEEKKIDIRPGDIFIFYTDGISEAMNDELNEFGEERLRQTINRNAQLSAGEIIEIVKSDIDAFVGKTPQHDDMTMIVLKIQ